MYVRAVVMALCNNHIVNVLQYGWIENIAVR